MNEDTQRIMRRIDHLRRSGKIIRVLTTLSVITMTVILSGGVLMLAFTSATLLTMSEGLTTGTASPPAGGDIVILFMMWSGLLVVGLLPHIAFYALADGLISLADHHYLQLNMLHRLGGGAVRPDSDTRRGQRKAASYSQKRSGEHYFFDDT